jgi:2-polyprenyl-6-methoxyphenol hydroxylase-like FAD-dependent oxidoreductase
VPGFVGSGTDKGFTSIRELYYAVHQSRDAISDALNPYAVERRNREAQVQA